MKNLWHFLRAWATAFRPWRLDNSGPYGFVTGKREAFREKGGKWI